LSSKHYLTTLGVPESKVNGVIKILSSGLPNIIKNDELKALRLKQELRAQLLGTTQPTISYWDTGRKGKRAREAYEKSESEPRLPPNTDRLRFFLQTVPKIGSETRMAVLKFYIKDPDRYEDYMNLYSMMKSVGVEKSKADFIATEFFKVV